MTPTQTQTQTQIIERKIDLLERSSKNSQSSAASTLKHYFGLAIDELDWDNKSEIDGIIDSIIDAAVAKAKAEILRDSLPDPLPSCEFDPN